ncbi:DUF6199 family natural product biosynthesis protein [Paenibacillus sp. GCM10023248]|uniref:DUF6199 family natural product biosynthesis protein n=1 Tax=Bacillales TaxID=1385 RepID=UPI002379710E|nr:MULTISPECIES: DUF6199 family natural product biosynthesis protein [Bacillales]MDD9270437.1 hypothetical protein [Paenibacillus sp. MAHUQ-63]MDR6884196.1 uncharacterized membrane protein HdeD (DUF308 family) [Bacillus sp. 3255]
MGFLGIFLVICGLLMLFKPSMIWNVTESWKSNDATEPSSLYVWSTRFGGVMVTMVGLACLMVKWVL